jgi:dTMP kinase
MSHRGALILVEGLDRSGKTTQTALLSKSIGGVQFQFPDRTTTIGAIIDEHLRTAAYFPPNLIHLLYAANRRENMKTIEDILNTGSTLVLDRYAHSGVAFSIANGITPEEWTAEADRGLIRPDVVLFLKIDPESAAKRGNYGEERYENVEFQSKVAIAYDWVKEHLVDQSEWIDIDATESIDVVLENLKRETLKVIERVKRDQSPLLKLWK